MITRFTFLLLLISTLLSSCSTTNEVVSDGLLQKRKYRKGFHVKSPLQPGRHTSKVQRNRTDKKNRENQISPMTTVSTFDSNQNFESLREETTRSISERGQKPKQLEMQVLHAHLMREAHSSSVHKRLAVKNNLVERFQKKLLIQEQKDDGFMYGLVGFILFIAGVLMIVFGVEFITSSFFIGLFFLELNSDLLFLGILLLSMGILSTPTGLTLSIISLIDHKKKDPKKQSSRDELDLNFAIATMIAFSFLILLFFIQPGFGF